MVHTGSADAWLQRFLLRLVNSLWCGLPEASLMNSRVLRAGVTDHPGLRAWCKELLQWFGDFSEARAKSLHDPKDLDLGDGWMGWEGMGWRSPR